MTGAVVQISVSRGGLPKYPIPQAFAGPLGLEGDSHAHPQIHGGPSRALLLVCAEAIETLAAQGYPLSFGALGENITTRGIDHLQMRTGQRYRLGQAMIELTKVRAPCSALNVYGPGICQDVYDPLVKAGNPSTARWARSGFYASVIQSGTIRLGDIIALIDQVV